MNNITKRQHFVPRFYLRQFTDETDTLYCYRKKDGKEFPAHPDDICFKEYGYEVKSRLGNDKFVLPNEIEKMFATLEGEYSQVLKTVVSKCLTNQNGASLICTTHEKYILASMVSNFLVRNFLAIDGYVDDEVTQHLLENNQEVRDIDILLREMKLGDAKPFIELAQKKLFLCPSEDGVAKHIIDTLLKMNVSFFVSDTVNFVTSDCPVGYNCNTEELLMARMPLSTRVMVVYSNSEISRQFRNRARLIKQHFIEKLNRDYFTWDISRMIITQSYEEIRLLTDKQ